MSTSPLQEVHVLGGRTRERIVRTARCEGVDVLGMALLGVSNAHPPYSMSTACADRGFVLACVGGCGKVLVEGNWRICRAGDAYLCPRGGSHAYKAVPGRKWHFVWTLYDRPPHWLDWSSKESRHTLCGHAYALCSAIEGLYRETDGPCDGAFSARWIELINAYWRSTAEGDAKGGRLALLWERVDSRLAHNWTLPELAKTAGLSIEHLRRICHAEVGRSPMAHLNHLRMRRADTLLQTGRITVASVAEAVGYLPFTFSVAYRRWSGMSPRKKLKDS